MPIVTCVYCDYIGQGTDIEHMWLDVRKHEKTCIMFQVEHEAERLAKS